MNTGVIDQFLNTFTTYIDSGFGLLNGEVAFLATTLVVIDITVAALFWAWSGGEEIIAHLIKKTLYVGFFALLIGNFNGFAKIIFNSFSGLGLKAAGPTLSAADFLHPGKIAQVGLDAGRPILQAAGSIAGFSAFFSPESWIQLIVLLIAWIFVIASFFILAIQLFVTLIEFKLTTLAGFVLVPFGLFGKTAFLAERVLGNVIASGVKVLVLAVIVGIGSGLFGVFTKGIGSTPGVDDALAIGLAALCLLGLGIYGPGIATGLTSGAPQLGAGAAVGTASAVFSGARAGASGAATTFSGMVATSAFVARAGRGAVTAVTGRPFNGSPPSGGGGGAPPWAQRMRRRQATSQGLGAVGQALRSGDRGGGSTSVNLGGGR
jgi:type IV secretion system protein TrbL